MDKLNFFDSIKNTYIIAEIGVNHNGNLTIAKDLINEAVKCGANAVKFQSYISSKLAAPETPKVKYQILNSLEENESHLEMLSKYEISKDDHQILKKYCDSKQIDFLSTPYDVESAKLLTKLNVKMFKTASADIVDYQLHRYIASTNKPTIISTGMSTIDEITATLSYYNNSKSSVILLHCVSNYPCSIGSINLNSIDFLRNKFNLPIGYSDHSSDNLAAVLSIALKTKVIEKHLTLDKEMKGPDHKASSTPSEFSNMVKEIRKTEKILGGFSKEVQEEENEMRRISRKSIYLKKNVLKNEKAVEDHFVLKRPGLGVNPQFIDRVLGKRYNREINEGELLDLKDIC